MARSSTSPATTLFISDLHLDAQRPAVTELFFDFLQHQTANCEALYILGDLFEAWIGDDDETELNQTVASALRQVSETGTRVYFIHGNRDFLLGGHYARSCHMELLPEITVIDLYGESTLIMHGDTLCTDDKDYQAFRSKARSARWQQQMLALPLEQRRLLAQQMREDSQHATALKAEDITDVNAQTVEQVMAAHQVSRLIHGHTHRPAVHDLRIRTKPAQRIVLGDWYEQGSVLQVNAQGYQLQGLSH